MKTEMIYDIRQIPTGGWEHLPVKGSVGGNDI